MSGLLIHGSNAASLKHFMMHRVMQGLSGTRTVGKRVVGLRIKGKKLSLARRTGRGVSPGEGEPGLRRAISDF